MFALLAACGFHADASRDAAPADAPRDAAPVDAAIAGDWLAVAASAEHTCAIRLDHSLWCWGDNEYGQSGVGSSASDVPAPTQIGSASWSTISAGAFHSCGTQTDGSLWCWGDNTYGELGVDETAGRVASETAPALVGGSGTYTAVAAGYVHTCAIAADQTLSCWGDNTYGELGTGSNAPSRVPVQVSTAAWTEVTAGDYTTCAIGSDQSLWCNGFNYYGELGLGTSVSTGDSEIYAPTQVPGAWLHVATQLDHTCGILADGHLRCWGINTNGELGDGTVTERWAPEVVGDDRDGWAAISVGDAHTCAARADGSLWCWGDDSFGATAASEGRAAINSTPALVDALPGVTALGLGGWHSCAITAGHALACTGLAALGQLGDGTTSGRAPTQVAGAWDRVSAGGTSTCARGSGGALACWGDNTFQQLADGAASPANAPAASAVPAPADVATGATYACETLADASVWCWGEAAYGDTGDVDGARQAPGVLTGVSAAGMSSRGHTCAIAAAPDTGLWCWGNNSEGELGTGDVMQTNVPRHVLMGTTVTAIAAGGEFSASGAGDTCAIAMGGALSCWGNDTYGQLGNGAASATPVLGATPVAGTWSRVALGAYHSCAIAQSGQLYCWGFGAEGQIGDGSGIARAAPAAVGSASWTQIALGQRHTCGIQSDGSLWCWGWNLRGEVGDGTSTDALVPVRVGSDTTWTDITAGDQYSCALRADDSLWCWGLGDSGQLGDGTAWRAAWMPVH